jgi:hypothetical protein
LDAGNPLSETSFVGAGLFETIESEITIGSDERSAGMFGMFFEEMNACFGRVIFQKLDEEGNEVEFLVVEDFFGELEKMVFRELEAGGEYLLA